MDATDEAAADSDDEGWVDEWDDVLWTNADGEAHNFAIWDGSYGLLYVISGAPPIRAAVAPVHRYSNP